MSGDDASTKRAQGKAVEFLLGARSLAGGFGWNDFNAFGVESDEWVTAYAAHSLAETGDRNAREAARQAWIWLVEQSRQHRPGLGYNTQTPQDADSTVWGYRLAIAIGQSSDECATRFLRFLLTCVQPGGGVATFPADGLSVLYKYIGNGADAIGGWTTSHACVTAAAAWLPDLVKSADLYGFLVRAQDSRGFWNGYWWADAEYATSHALESLARGGTGRESLDLGASWLAGSLGRRSPFGLALRAFGIAKAGHDNFEPALQELLTQQLADGSWRASARLRIPPPNLKDPRIQWNWDEENPGIGSLLLDQRRIFTTATALRALSACLQR